MIEIRDLLAALWLDHDIEDGDPFAAGWALGLIASRRDAEHSGDCTNEPHACVRCRVDCAFTAAAAILSELGKAGYEVRAK